MKVVRYSARLDRIVVQQSAPGNFQREDLTKGAVDVIPWFGNDSEPERIDERTGQQPFPGAACCVAIRTLRAL